GQPGAKAVRSCTASLALAWRAEPAGVDHRGTRAALDGLLDRGRDQGGGHRDGDRVGSLRELAERGEARPAGDLRISRVDRVDLAGKPDAVDVLDCGQPPAGSLRGADDGDGGWVQQLGELG